MNTFDSDAHQTNCGNPRRQMLDRTNRKRDDTMMTSQRLEEIRTQLEAAAPDGKTWSVGYDSCDCGDGYGCPHGSWPQAIYGPTNVQMLDRSEGIQEGYGHTIGEIAELADEAAELMAGAPQIIRELLAEVERQRARAKFFEKAQRKVVIRFNNFADAHEQCDISQEADEPNAT